MARYVSVVMSNPRDDADDAFNRFLDEQHLPDVLAVPGFVSAERFRLAAGAGQYQYMTLYQVETDDLPAMIAEVRRRIESGEMPLSDASDPGQAFSAFFQPVAG